MRIVPAVVSGLLAAGLAAAASAGRAGAAPAGWAQFRGAGGQGISSDRNVPEAWGPDRGIRWKAALPGAGTSSPIVVGQRIYLTCYTGSPEQIRRQLVCLDRASGKIAWQAEVPPGGPEESRIRENHGYASSTPAADAERIYVFFGRAGVFAFDHSGRRLWRAAVGERTHGWGSAASPVLYQNLVIVNAGVESESLVALDRTSGREVWRAGGIRESWNTPVLVPLPGGKTELAVAIFGRVLGFDPATGAALWNCATEIPWYMVPSLVARDGVVYCIGGRGGGGSLAIRAGGRGDVTRSHRLWAGSVGSNVPSPLLHGEHLYWVKDSPPVAYCAEARTGRVLYEERLERADQVYASPVLAAGRIYYTARNGRTWVVPAAPRFQVLAVNEPPERGIYNSSPAVAEGFLFLRADQNLFCIGP